MRMWLAWLSGYVSLTFACTGNERIWNCALKNHVEIYRNFQADGKITIWVSRSSAQKLQQELPEAGGAKACGLPALLRRYRGRAGLAAGALCACALLLWGSGIVWDVRVNGTERLAGETVLQELREGGLRVGMAVSELDEKAVSAAVLTSSEDIAWLGINRRGNVVYVEVIEQKNPPLPPENTTPANLVAVCDAVIDSLAVERGVACVHAGSVVKAGDLLVSGVTEGLHGAHLVRAGGAVYGRVEKHLAVEVPRSVVIPVTDERQTVTFSVNFFEKSALFSRDTGNLPAEYDIIEKKDVLYLPGGTPLPFSVSRRVAVWHTGGEYQRSDAEMADEALRQMHAQLVTELQDAQLLTKHLRGVFEDDVYRLTCDVICIENIAKTAEIGR